MFHVEHSDSCAIMCVEHVDTCIDVDDDLVLGK